MNSDRNIEADNLTYLINHLFLPPILPQEDDSSTAGTQALLRHVADSAHAFQNILRQQNVDIGVLDRWDTLRNMLRSMEVLHQSVHIPLEDLRRSIDNMQMHGTFTFGLVLPIFSYYLGFPQVSSPSTSRNKTSALSSAKTAPLTSPSSSSQPPPLPRP